jgi:hypothetical protein
VGSAARPLGDDPLALASRLLARADESPSEDGARALLARALEALDRARDAGGGEDARALAHRAEVLRRLGRLPEAAATYARVLEARLDRPEGLREGIEELSRRLCGHEEALRLAALASERHPGRAWEWEGVAARARTLLSCEREAPISPEALALLRAEVARRLSRSPCAHDDARPLATAAARAAGHDPDAVLAWLARLGACCCDCQVASVRGPREPDAPPGP